MQVAFCLPFRTVHGNTGQWQMHKKCCVNASWVVSSVNRIMHPNSYGKGYINFTISIGTCLHPHGVCPCTHACIQQEGGVSTSCRHHASPVHVITTSDAPGRQGSA
jgi:hypothetical protein